jgi:hypothetical protein
MVEPSLAEYAHRQYNGRWDIVAELTGDGSCRMVIPFRNPEPLERWVLAFAGRTRLTKPDDVVASLRRRIEAIIYLHEQPRKEGTTTRGDNY